MNTSLLLVFFVIMAPGWPNVRIDHENLPTHICHYCAIAVGPGAPSNPPLYVVFQDDSCSMGVRADIWFQKSTDGGRTWLAEDQLIRRGERYAFYPDITTDPDGNVYVLYLFTDTASRTEIVCVRSSDGGSTWSAPARATDDGLDATIGDATIAAGSAGSLFCAWNDWRTGSGHIWSSVSTDQGATWGRNVQVDDDTTNHDCYQPDVFVQPGTDHYLVAAEASRWFGGHVIPCVFLYRSTDRGQTFQPGVQLDTFNYAAWSPHVVADRDHIICDYFGKVRNGRLLVEARTFYTQPDTWGTPCSVASLDSLHDLYYSGMLALSAGGRVHTALIICDTIDWSDHVYHTSSSDNGVSWSDLELVDEDTTLSSGYPDIGTDSAGHAYVVWPHGNAGQFRIWFATNNPLAIAEQPVQPPLGVQPIPTVVRSVLLLPGATSYEPQAASLMDATGRKVLDLHPGTNDVRALAPGVYFLRGPKTEDGRPDATLRKVVLTR
jgi:hypothetical protein